MKRLNIMQPILDAIDETEESMSRHMNQLIKWAKYCEKSIGSYRGYKFKTAVITVSGSTVVLPADCYHPVALFLGDLSSIVNLRYLDETSAKIHVENISDIDDIEYVWSELSYPNTTKLVWEEIGSILSLVDGYDSQKVTLIYQYIETDIQGYWLINESHSDAVKKYVIYMIAKKYMFKNFKSSKLTRNADIMMVNEYKRDYNIAIRNARALDNEHSPLDIIG